MRLRAFARVMCLLYDKMMLYNLPEFSEITIRKNFNLLYYSIGRIQFATHKISNLFFNSHHDIYYILRERYIREQTCVLLLENDIYIICI